MSIYMETTSIPAEETVAQIQRILGRYGASAIMTEYEDGNIKALSFKVRCGEVEVPFRLPCRHEAVYTILAAKKRKFRSDTEDKLKVQAKNVAWRQILRWIEAQMALVETSMVKMQEVMMPYIQVDLNGRTLFEKMESGKFLEFKRGDH